MVGLQEKPQNVSMGRLASLMLMHGEEKKQIFDTEITSVKGL